MRYAGLLLALLASCGGGGRAAPAPPGTTLLVSEGLRVLEPASTDPDGVPVYDVAAQGPFQVEARTFGAGAVRLSLAHLEDGGAAPRPEWGSMTWAKLHYAAVPAATLAQSEFPWTVASGHGSVTLAIGGEPERPQLLALRAEGEAGVAHARLRLRTDAAPELPPRMPAAAVDERTLLRSNAAQAGSVAVAAAGDAAFLVLRDGNSADPSDATTFQLRVLAGDAPLAGASVSAAPAHAVAARGDLVAVAEAATDALRLRISEDGGATFRIAATLPPVALPRMAVAPDGRVLVAGWRGRDLVLADDLGGARLLRRVPANAIPAPAAIAFAADGAPRIAYAFTEVGAGSVRARFRLWSPAVDRLVDTTDGLTGGPGLAVRGASVLYAADAPDGIRIYEDGVRAETVAGPGAHTPRLAARGARVDLLHLQATTRGTQLMVAGAAGTAPQRQWTVAGPPDATVHAGWNDGFAGWQPHPHPGFHGWDLAGYDAAVVGGAIHVVCHEFRVDRFFLDPVPGKPVEFRATAEVRPWPSPPAPPPTESTATPYDTDRYFSFFPRHRVRQIRID